MGTDRSDGDLRGFLVPDPRITLDNLVSKTDGTVPSSYSQEGSYTGPSVPDQDTRLVLRTSGEQSEDGDLEVYTARAGGIGPESAGFIFRDVGNGDGRTEYKGWDGFQLVTGWETLLWTEVAQGANLRPHVIRLDSGKLLALYSVTSLGVIRVKRYDPDEDTWTSADCTPTEAGTGYVTTAATLCQLPSGRVLLYCTSNDEEQVDVYYSDDEGDSWSAGGYRVLDTGLSAGATPIELRAAYSAQELLLIYVFEKSGSGQRTASQYASSDLGTSYERIRSDIHADTGEEPDGVDIIPGLDSGFIVAFRDESGTNDYLCRSFGYAAEGWQVTSAVTIHGSSDYCSTAWRDEDSRIYAATTSSTQEGMDLSYSDDEGASWDGFDDTLAVLRLHNGATSTNRFEEWSAAAVGGRTALLTRWTASSADEDPMSVGVVWLGGYATQTAPASDTTAHWAFRDEDYISWGPQPISLTAGGIWLPAEEPDQVDWTPDAAGTADLVDPGVLELTTSTTKQFYYRALSDGDYVYGCFQVDLDSGDGNTGSNEVAAHARLANASSYDYAVAFRLADTGVAVYDEQAAGNVGTITADLTSRFTCHFLMSKGKIRTWYAEEDDHGHIRNLVAGPAGAIQDGGATANSSRISFGHLSSGTATSRWHMVAYCCWPGRWTGLRDQKAIDSWVNPTDLHPRSYPGTSAALLTDTVQIQAVAGPSWFGETQRIEAVYEYGVQNIDPYTVSSPGKTYRTTGDNKEVALVWDLEATPGFSDSFFESTSIGAFVVKTNVPRMKLQGYTGAAWDDICTLDGRWSNRPYTRKGRIVWPSSGTTGYYSFHETHAQDSIKLESGGESVIRKIQHNAEGAWATDTKMVRLYLDEDYLDGTEGASGTCEIWRRNYGAVVHDYSQSYRYIRLLIPATKTAEGYYELGQVCIGPVFPFGLQYGTGWAREHAYSYDLSTWPGGQRTVRTLGGSRRAVELSWAGQAQDTSRVWGTSPSPDYVTGVAGGDPVASISDTVMQVLGIGERLDGAATPVVYLGRVPRGDSTYSYTLDEEWLYGRLVTEAPSADHVIGDEGSSEVLRLNKIKVEEEI